MPFRRKKPSEDASELNSYEIWQEKQAEIETAEIEKIKQETSSKGYLQWINPMTYVGGFWSSLLDDNRREAIKVIISMFGILATASAAVGLIWTVWDATEDRKLTQERLITDRFSKAATLLSNEDNAVRIAAIFSLERIAKDSPKDHWTIMELLSAYVLERSPLDEKDKVAKDEKKKIPKPNSISKQSPSAEATKESPKSPKPIANDVQAALTVIGRRETEQDLGKQLDLSSRGLSNANLSNADLRSADLNSADLSSADLSGAYLFRADLLNANLRNANLPNADLSSANLPNAYLSNADLSSANLLNAYLSNADLSSADLSSANLSGAYLFSADLRSADLNSADLSSADLSGAYLFRANLLNANLLNANLLNADLRSVNLFSADLRRANLSSAILLNSNLLVTENLTKSQLESKDPPLICNSPLPQNIKIDSNRDCGKVASVLHKRYPNEFASLDKAEKYVQEQRQKKWD